MSILGQKFINIFINIYLRLSDVIKIKQNDFVIIIFLHLMFLSKHKSIGYTPMPDDYYVFKE